MIWRKRITLLRVCVSGGSSAYEMSGVFQHFSTISGSVNQAGTHAARASSAWAAQQYTAGTLPEWRAGGSPATMGVLPMCALLAAAAPASCFLTGTRTLVPSRVAPSAQQQQQQSSRIMSTTSMAAQAVAWPDEVTAPSLDQPVRARILAVAPDGVASPFEDRGTAVPWFEVCA